MATQMKIKSMIMEGAASVQQERFLWERYRKAVFYEGVGVGIVSTVVAIGLIIVAAAIAAYM